MKIKEITKIYLKIWKIWKIKQLIMHILNLFFFLIIKYNMYDKIGVINQYYNMR